jgi:hypothetical protein
MLAGDAQMLTPTLRHFAFDADEMLISFQIFRSVRHQIPLPACTGLSPLRHQPPLSALPALLRLSLQPLFATFFDAPLFAVSPRHAFDVFADAISLIDGAILVSRHSSCRHGYGTTPIAVD